MFPEQWELERGSWMPFMEGFYTKLFRERSSSRTETTLLERGMQPHSCSRLPGRFDIIVYL
jgi:hypothetical protein